MTNTTESNTQPSHNEIAAYAYHLWEADGHKHGRDLEYWHQARAHLASQSAKTSPPSPARESNGNGNGNRPENNKKRKPEAAPATRRQPAFASA